MEKKRQKRTVFNDQDRNQKPDIILQEIPHKGLQFRPDIKNDISNNKEEKE